MEEEIKVLKNCWVMTTDHVLDAENIALKLAIKNVLTKLQKLEYFRVYVSETCIDFSKSHCTAEQAINDIRKQLDKFSEV